MRICGIDEAGRGSALGPLVVAGISIEKSNIRKLKSIGIKDSKKLSINQRQQFYKQIIDIVNDYSIISIHPKSIDSYVFKHRLNDLEVKYMARIISKLKPDTSYVDSCDVIPKRFTLNLQKQTKYTNIHSHHHADSKFYVVSAASILAKVKRDSFIIKLNKSYDIGSGYPSDFRTIDFLKNYLQKNKSVPKFARKSWKPVKKLVEYYDL